MKVFLTGATGYVGSAIAEQLRAAGHHIVALAHHEAAVAKIRAAGMETLAGGLNDPAVLRSGASKAEAVIHAGFPKLPDFTAALEQDRQTAILFIEALAGTDKPFLFTSGGMLVLDQAVGTASERIGHRRDADSDPAAVLVAASVCRASGAGGRR